MSNTVRATTEVLTLTFGFRAYAKLIRCPAIRKQLNEWRCMLLLMLYIPVLDSLASFTIRFRSLDHSFDQSIRLRHFVISSQTRLRSSITVHLLYISLPGSTVRLPHDFVVYRVLIVLPVEVVIDKLIKTTSTAITREQSFRRDTVSCINCSIVCCFVLHSFRIGLKPFSNSKHLKIN